MDQNVSLLIPLLSLWYGPNFLASIMVQTTAFPYPTPQANLDTTTARASPLAFGLIGYPTSTTPLSVSLSSLGTGILKDEFA